MPAALDILRVFYRTGAPFLPVVDKDRLIGIISREELTAHASDASRAEESFERIPEDFFLAEPYGPDVFAALGSARHCAVLSKEGEAGQMDSSRILAMIPAKKRESVPEAQPRPGAPEEVNLWLSRLLLSAIPFPLYVMDLKGKTLFYNGAFESAVLSHQQFRSVARCEKSFLELSRELLAESIAAGKESAPMRGIVRETGSSVWMITLIDAGRVAGYMFAFEWQEALDQGLFDRMTAQGMDRVMDDLEKRVLLSALGQTDYNISRTADLLQTRRTTLQSRMKRLHLPLKAPSRKQKRQQAVSVKKKAAKKSRRPAPVRKARKKSARKK